jgi:excisionase family DNA binding protein
MVAVMKLRELENWLTPREAAQRVGISRQALVKSYLDNGKLRAVRTHAGWLIDPESVDQAKRERGQK